MPLRAFFAGRELLAPLMSDEEWLNLKAQRPKVRLCCCDSTGYLRTSKLGTKHFVHGKNRICNWAPETWQHLLAKTEIVRVCQQFGGRGKNRSFRPRLESGCFSHQNRPGKVNQASF